MNKFLISICIILILSLGFNIYFMVNGPIKIVNNNAFDQRQDQRQFQYQGQLNVYGNLVSGNDVVWDSYECNGVSKKTAKQCVIDLLKSKHIIESYFAKVVKKNNGYIGFDIFIPRLITEKKKAKK